MEKLSSSRGRDGDEMSKGEQGEDAPPSNSCASPGGTPCAFDAGEWMLFLAAVFSSTEARYCK